MKRIFGVLLGAMLPAALASAQIQYTIDGGTPVAVPASRIINVGTLVNPVTTLHIFDSSGIDDSIVGQVEIQGTATSETALHIKVVSQGDTEAFTGQPNLFLFPGLRDFGGLTFSNTALRDRSILALAIRGNITGDIDAGQVWRIDALSDENNTFGGHIYGNITAHQPNNAVIADAESIGYVRASVGISGNIEAIGVRDVDPESLEYGKILYYGSISRVIVGPAESNEGILGDILAEDGSIGAVYTTGPIGGGLTTPRIWAGDGIVEVRAIPEGGTSSSVLVKDFQVSIQANKMMQRMLQTTYPWVTPNTDGVLGRL